MKKIACGLFFFSFFNMFSYAQDILPVHKAFLFSVKDHSDVVSLKWVMKPNYYLYKNKIQFYEGGKKINITLPSYSKKTKDINFGEMDVYYNHLEINLTKKKNMTYHVVWQGCAKDQICYVAQRYSFLIDEKGKLK